MASSCTLDIIYGNNPGRIAVIEMHKDTNYLYFLQEAWERARYYPPPVYSGGVWGFYTPYLWCDGRKGGTNYNNWRSFINNRLNAVSYVTVHMWGTYTPLRGTGTVYASFRNDSSGTMRGRVRFVLEEDSLYFAGPNGDTWHNHVARDYLPDTGGTFIQLNPAESTVVSRGFTVQSGWNVDRCWIVTWLQKDTLLADSTRPVYQAGAIKVSSLMVQIEEGKPWLVRSPIIVFPNPCLEGAKFSFDMPPGARFEIAIYDIAGNKIDELSGITAQSPENVTWDRTDGRSQPVNPGIYFYTFQSGVLKQNGKIILR